MLIGLVHAVEVPEGLKEAPYLGVLFGANAMGALIAAVGIHRGRGWGWALGALVAGGALVGYIVSRTTGLPGVEVEKWLEPLGVLSLVLEALFLLLLFRRAGSEPAGLERGAGGGGAVGEKEKMSWALPTFVRMGRGSGRHSSGAVASNDWRVLMRSEFSAMRDRGRR